MLLAGALIWSFRSSYLGSLLVCFGVLNAVVFPLVRHVQAKADQRRGVRLTK